MRRPRLQVSEFKGRDFGHGDIAGVVRIAQITGEGESPAAPPALGRFFQRSRPSPVSLLYVTVDARVPSPEGDFLITVTINLCQN